MSHQSDSRLACLAVALPLLLCCACAAEHLGGDPVKADDSWESEVRQKVYASVLPEDAKGFRVLAAPKQHDAGRNEVPQSLEVYRAAARIRPTPERRTIVLQPLGKFNEEQAKTLELLREYAAIFFQLPARLEQPLALELPDKQLFKNVPIGNRRENYDKQYNGDRVMMELLAPKLPDDAVVYLGITMEDLYCARHDYVFGVASLDKRVGVYSLYRYYPESVGMPRSEGDDVKALRRACKVLNHEASHAFGLTHCVLYRCSMNYSRTLSDVDDTPIHFCPVCHRKLLWNIAFDPAKRYAALKDFYEQNDMEPEAKWLASRIKHWKLVAAADEARKAKDE